MLDWPCPDWHESDDHSVWPFCVTCSSCGAEPTSRLQFRVEVLRIFKISLYANVPPEIRWTEGVSTRSASLHDSRPGSAGPAAGPAAGTVPDALPDREGGALDDGAGRRGRHSRVG